MKKGLKYVGYAFYAVLVAILLLYVRFPSASLEAFLVRKAESMTPSVLYKMESLGPSFPPGIQLKSSSFSLRDHSKAVFFESKELFIKPEITSLLFGENTWIFDAVAYGGTIGGRISVDEHGKVNGFEVSLENVRIQDYGFLPDFGIGSFSGSLNANISFNGSFDRVTGADGTGKINISEGKLRLLAPFLGLETIPFGQLSARCTLKKGAVSLTSVSLDGKAFQGSLSGTVYLNQMMDRSRLNLKGTIEPIAPYLETLKGGPALLSLFGRGQNGPKRSFVIQGTIRSPKFRFI